MELMPKVILIVLTFGTPRGMFPESEFRNLFASGTGRESVPESKFCDLFTSAAARAVIPKSGI